MYNNFKSDAGYAQNHLRSLMENGSFSFPMARYFIGNYISPIAALASLAALLPTAILNIVDFFSNSRKGDNLQKSYQQQQQQKYQQPRKRPHHRNVVVDEYLLFLDTYRNKNPRL